MAVTMWSGWRMEYGVRLFYSEQALTSQQTSCSDHWSLAECQVALAKVSGKTITEKGKTVHVAPEYFLNSMYLYLL